MSVLAVLLLVSVIGRPAYAQKDPLGEEAVRTLAEKLQPLAGDICSLELGVDEVLTIKCEVSGFPLAKYCGVDAPQASISQFVDFYRSFVDLTLDELPGRSVVDYEVMITGTSDGEAFVRDGFDTYYNCAGQGNFGQKAISETQTNLDVRLGIFRGMTAWHLMYEYASVKGFPLLYPVPEFEAPKNAPGRTTLATVKDGQFGGMWRKAMVEIRVLPRIVLRCQPGTHYALSNGYETCLPDCPFGTEAFAASGTVVCLPRCEDGNYLVLADGEYRCESRCANCDFPEAAPVMPPRAHPVVGLNLGFFGGTHYYGERAAFEFGMVGQSVSWFLGLGGVFKHNDNAFGIMASGTIKVNAWDKPAVYPRISVVFQNYSGGLDTYVPFWAITAEPALDWEFYRFTHGTISLLVTLQLGMRVADSDYIDGAVLRTRTDYDFLAGGGLGLGFYFW